MPKTRIKLGPTMREIPLREQDRAPVLPSHHHFACAAGHQIVLLEKVWTAAQECDPSPMLCEVCRRPFVKLGWAPQDLWNRKLVIVDNEMAPATMTPCVVLRNYVAASGFSYVEPQWRTFKALSHVRTHVHHVGWLDDTTHLVAVEEEGFDTTVFKLEPRSDGTWEITRYTPTPHTATTPMPYGLNERDTALFYDLWAFIKVERCSDTWLYTPTLWKNLGGTVAGDGAGLVLVIVSEGSGGLCQLTSGGKDGDRLMLNRFRKVLEKHSIELDRVGNEIHLSRSLGPALDAVRDQYLADKARPD